MNEPEPRPFPPAERFRRRIAALAHFGTRALAGTDLDEMLHDACAMVSEQTDTQLVKAIELLPGGEEMLMRAGVNWRPGVVGRVTFGAHAHSPSGYALQQDEPVLSSDTDVETRFEIPQVMRDHGVRSMVNVVIRGKDGAWGVLEADGHAPREFDEDDIDFLQSVANVLAAGIDRLKRDAELRRTMDLERFLLSELRHRVRNLIMNVDALAKRTARTSETLPEFGANFGARLAALARTQDLLGRGPEAVDLRETLSEELEAHGIRLGGDRVAAEGPKVELPPKVAQALGMAFHELATNAGKHGALGRDGGALLVSWEVRPGPEGRDLAIRWRETGVPLSGRPERRGFGSDAIERHLPYMLGGEGRLAYEPDGLVCTLRFPLPEPVDGVLSHA